MTKYRKKPVVIEAVQWTGDNFSEILAFVEGNDGPGTFPVEIEQRETYLDILTPEGVMAADPGDMIIRGIAGEYYPCKKDIFAATYEAVSADMICGDCAQFSEVDGCVNSHIYGSDATCVIVTSTACEHFEAACDACWLDVGGKCSIEKCQFQPKRLAEGGS